MLKSYTKTYFILTYIQIRRFRPHLSLSVQKYPSFLALCHLESLKSMHVLVIPAKSTHILARYGPRVESMPCAIIAFGCREWRATQMSLQKLQPHILWRTLAAWFIIAFTGRGKSRLVALIVCRQCFGDCTADITRENSGAKITSAVREKRPPTLICTILHLSERCGFWRNSLPITKKLMNRTRNGVKRSEKWNYGWR